eukprot:Selendium_serpulae@DN6393_c0_g1_i10.p1
MICLRNSVVVFSKLCTIRQLSTTQLRGNRNHRFLARGVDRFGPRTANAESETRLPQIVSKPSATARHFVSPRRSDRPSRRWPRADLHRPLDATPTYESRGLRASSSTSASPQQQSPSESQASSGAAAAGRDEGSVHTSECEATLRSFLSTISRPPAPRWFSRGGADHGPNEGRRAKRGKPAVVEQKGASPTTEATTDCAHRVGADVKVKKETVENSLSDGPGQTTLGELRSWLREVRSRFYVRGQLRTVVPDIMSSQKQFRKDIDEGVCAVMPFIAWCLEQHDLNSLLRCCSHSLFSKLIRPTVGASRECNANLTYEILELYRVRIGKMNCIHDGRAATGIPTCAMRGVQRHSSLPKESDQDILRNRVVVGPLGFQWLRPWPPAQPHEGVGTMSKSLTKGFNVQMEVDCVAKQRIFFEDTTKQQ